MQSLVETDIETLYQNLSAFTPDEQKQILVIVEELERRNHAKKCQLSLIDFCKHMDPAYLVGTHHRKLAELLEQIAYGQKDRIAVSIPPRHGKSHLASTLFPAWFLGKYPDKKVLMVSHTTDLSVDFGRKVRNLIASPAYQEIFPGVALAQDSKSAGRWNTSKGGEYFACGVGSNIAGRGADLLLVDDPHSEQDLLAGNFDALEKAYQWFTFGARTRLMSGGRVAVIHCMTGDTNVLMADGTEKMLCHVRPNDVVASYDTGTLVPAKVLNWANQGPDYVFTIRTTLGKILRANGKHPLLINLNGEQQWVKVRNLKVGMSLMGVSLPHQVNAVPKDVTRKSMHLESAHTTTTRIGESYQSNQSLPNGVSGGELIVQKTDAVSRRELNTLQKTGAYVITTTVKQSTPGVGVGVVQNKIETRTLSTDTVSVLNSTTECLSSKTESVPYVDSHQPQKTLHQTGMENLGLTTATMGSESERCFATLVTSLSVETQQKKHYKELLNTYVPILDQIADVSLNGYEDVFDIQVEGTENFIANGVISHNTRWHQDDLIGHLVKDGANNPKADQYEVFEFPAIINTLSGVKALWPEKFDLTALERTKASMPSYQWNAQYMQSPTAEEAAIIKRDWWRPWKADKPPVCDYLIMTLDAAAEKHTRADFTALLTFGIFSDDELTDGASHLILLNAINVRVEFPELKDLAFREYKDWEPDSFIVEKKNAGTQLYQELRRAGIPVQEFTPNKTTGDKVVRLNAVADILRSGMVWYPEGRRWAEDVIEQCTSFPYGSHDDMVDCVSMALARFRQGGFIQLPTDWQDPPSYYRRKAAYY